MQGGRRWRRTCFNRSISNWGRTAACISASLAATASGGSIPLIAAGGIENADDAWDRIVAGASLVQLYSAMVYEGPGLAKRIAHGLAERLRRSGMSSIAEAMGSR